MLGGRLPAEVSRRRNRLDDGSPGLDVPALQKLHVNGAGRGGMAMNGPAWNSTARAGPGGADRTASFHGGNYTSMLHIMSREKIGRGLGRQGQRLKVAGGEEQRPAMPLLQSFAELRGQTTKEPTKEPTKVATKDAQRNWKCSNSRRGQDAGATQEPAGRRNLARTRAVISLAAGTFPARAASQ